MRLRLQPPTIKEVIDIYPSQLDNRFGPARNDVEELLMHALKCDQAHLLAFPEQRLRSWQFTKFKMMFEKRLRGIPLQYIFKVTTFCGLPFKVTNFTLIPRPETEQLVEEVAKYVSSHPIRNIVDIGTGTGAIIVSLAKKLEQEKDFFFIGTDKSVRALQVARLNAIKNKANVHFYSRDFIKKPFTFLPMTSWVLVSNPPYLTEEELKEPSIEFEPRMALYGGADGLDAYRTMIEQIIKFENKPKAIFFEIGYKQGQAVRELAQQLNPQSVEVIKDFCGKDRIVKIEL